MNENLVSKEQVETLTEFQHKVDAAKMEGPLDGDDHIWVETSPAICKYFNRQGLGKSGYFDYHGIKVCETGRAEEIKKKLRVQLGELIHGDAKENMGSATRPVAGVKQG